MTRPSRRWVIAAAATIAVWCGLELGLRRASSITDDQHGWRQADTQAIARNLAFEEMNPLRPRIDWRGDGPGYVETELQLYPALIAVAMRVTGESLWPGQLISLACVALTAWLLFAALARRFGNRAGYVALLAMLSTQGVVVAGTSIQPDPLALLGFTLGFLAFVAWLDAPSRGRLVAWVAATAIAGLVKPTTLELGIAQGVLVLIAHRGALRRPALWLGWGIVVAVVVGFLLYARGLYLDHGNTFGVLSGGDSKLPALAAIATPRPWIDLARFFVIWGVGIPAVPAAVYLIWRRALGPEELALAAGALVLSVLALRYTSGPYGTHYHLPHVVLGAWLVARAVAQLTSAGRASKGPSASRASRRGAGLRRGSGARRPLAYRIKAEVARGIVGVGVIASVLLYARAVRYVRTLPREPETAVGRMLAHVAAPGTLVVVRARAPRVDPQWHTTNNFEDPRVFYLSRTHGWVVANDDPGAARVRDAAAQGARFYAHVNQVAPDAELAAWLAANADVVATGAAGAVYRLRQ